ncbi:MAG: DUF5719 family protein [Georgenia sp.]
MREQDEPTGEETTEEPAAEVLPEAPAPGGLPAEAVEDLPEEAPLDERLEEVLAEGSGLLADGSGLPAEVESTGATGAEDEAEPAAGPEHTEPAVREPTGRVVLRRLGATTSALVLLAAVVGAVVAGEATSPPPAGAVVAGVVDVPAGTATAVCAGPPTLTAGAGMGVDPDLDPADVTTRSLTTLVTLPRGANTPAEGSAVALDGGARDLTRTGAARTLAVADPAGPTLFAAQPVDGVAALAAGASVSRTDAGDLRGLVASACLTPATTTWLVGGATQPGQSAQLVLTNPGQTPVTVDVTLWSSLGPVGAPRLSGIVVAPGSQTEVLLEAAATPDARLAMRVDAAGGSVTATLQDHRLDGVVAAGIETVPPTLPPALTLTIPGVRLERSTLEHVAVSAVRVVNPGEEVATVAVRLLGADGEVAVPGAEKIMVDPGAVVDVSLAGLEPGAYAAEVVADRPVTGAVVLARTGQAGEFDPDVAPVDLAWTAAAAPATSGTLLVPGRGSLVDGATLSLTNPTDGDVTVTLLPWSAAGATGKERVVDLPARSTVGLAVEDLGDDVAMVQLLPAEGGGGTAGAPAGGTAGAPAPEGDGGTTDASEGGGGTSVLAAVVLTATVPDGELISVLPLQLDPHDARAIRVAVR